MSEAESKKVPVGVSARHIHLSQEHVEVLFGAGAKLTEFKPLSQPGQFAANETVAVFGPKGSFPKVRILGPARKATQLEVSRTDAFSLGLNPPVRESGNIENTPGIRIVGPAGEVTVDQGVIVAALSVTNGPLLRADSAWIARAANSLPEPDGPTIIMRLLVGATRSMV